MTICRCGVEIRWCTLNKSLSAVPVVKGSAGDTIVPIEPSITLTKGPDRYRVVAYGERWTVEQLDPTSLASGHPDHRRRCPR